MAYTLSVGINLGSSQTGLTLKALLVDTAGATVGSEVATGFVELGVGNYSWTYASFPDGFRGSAKFYTGTLPTGLKATCTLNSEEAEISAILARLPAALFNGWLNVNVKGVNDVAVDGTGTLGDPWGPV